MSTGTKTGLKGKYDEVAGKVKQSAGEAVNNQKVANEGAAQQVKGHGEQALGSVKRAAEDSRERHEAKAGQKAHDVRESVTSTARNVKEHIQNAASGHRDAKK